MTLEQWDGFCRFRDAFRRQCSQWSSRYAGLLQPLQKAASSADTPSYPLETEIVYNTALDEVSVQDDIRLMVIGDNPGKDEQRSANRRYLVGQAGKLAAGFFARNPELGIDFRKNVIILNKTPVHTAKTTHLRYLLQNGTSEIASLIRDSQQWMAEQTVMLHSCLTSGGNRCPLWLVGYSELKQKGLFSIYREMLVRQYGSCTDSCRQQVFVYQHFSMNRFAVDLKECDFTCGAADRALSGGKTSGDSGCFLSDDSFAVSVQAVELDKKLAYLGSVHRREIFPDAPFWN